MNPSQRKTRPLLAEAFSPELVVFVEVSVFPCSLPMMETAVGDESLDAGLLDDGSPIAVLLG